MPEIGDFSKENDARANIPEPKQRINTLSSSVKNKVRTVLDYMNAGLVPNLLGTFSASVAAIMSEPRAIGINVGAALINYATGFLKYREYRKIRAALEEHGWDERIVKPKSRFFCQRWAAYLAAKRTGHEQEIRDFFEREGHEWWHLIPKVHRFHETDNSPPDNK